LKKFYKYIIYFIATILISSCAQIVAPTGGKLDKDAPKALKQEPSNGTTNFASKSITISFDEFIQLKDLNNQLIISPPLQFTPDIKTKNRELIIEFDKKEQLKPNTTYSINLGNAIQDIHESTPFENFSYYFSTGNILDSMKIAGKVENAFDTKTEKATLVLLYKNYTDSSVYKALPDYVGKTKEDGTFEIKNISAGSYKLIALKDANANFKYDSESEKIGFVDTLIDVTKNKKNTVRLFQEPAKKTFIKYSGHNYFGKVLLVLNKPAENISIKPINNSFNETDVFIDFSKNKDSIHYWFRNIEKDSIIMQVKENTTIIDTLAFKLTKKADAINNRRNPLKFQLTSSANKNQNVELNSEFAINFSHPIEPSTIEKIKNKEIKLVMDSIPYPNSKDLFYSQATRSGFVIKQKNNSTEKPFPFKENSKYSLFIEPGTFTDIFGFTNDTIQLNFKTREEKQYGSIKLKLDVSNKSKNYIVQLVDEKENIIREANTSKADAILFQYLLPKNYKLKVICDDNANLKWDTGNLQKGIQPEKVIYNAETITTKANWDLDLDWKIIE
jgi:hypothetical protein